MESARPIKLLHKWPIWTVLMPYLCDAFEAYFLLNQFSKESRKELINNFAPFKNSMLKYRKEVIIKDLDEDNLIRDRLENAKNRPLILLKLNFSVNTSQGLEDISEFEEWFQGIEEIPAPKYTGSFMPVDHSFLSTAFEYGNINTQFKIINQLISSAPITFKKAPIFKNHIKIKNVVISKPLLLINRC